MFDSPTARYKHVSAAYAANVLTTLVVTSACLQAPIRGAHKSNQPHLQFLVILPRPPFRNCFVHLATETPLVAPFSDMALAVHCFQADAKRFSRFTNERFAP